MHRYGVGISPGLARTDIGQGLTVGVFDFNSRPVSARQSMAGESGGA